MFTRHRFYLSLMVCYLLGASLSLCFPYLERLNISSDYFKSHPFVVGYEYEMAVFVVVLMLTTTIFAFYRNYSKWACIVSLITLGFVYWLRCIIHFQGMIDHDYDSKTGIGFRMLFVFLLVQFLAVILNEILKKRKINRINTTPAKDQEPDRHKPQHS